jgi:hypothetical protein
MNISCPTSNIPTMVRSNPPCKKKDCSICESFVEDWLQIQFVSTDYFYDKVNYKRLKRNSHELAKEFCFIIKRITPLVEYMLTKNINKHRITIQNQIIPKDFPEELIPESIWISISNIACFKTFEKTDFHADLDYICTRIEEECICKHMDFIYEFVGHCLQHVILHIPSLHQEHMGTKTVSYTGPPIGMAIQPLKNPIQELEREYNCKIESIVLSNPSDSNVCLLPPPWEL